MATQRIIIARVAGASATHLASSFRGRQGARRSDDVQAACADEWPRRHRPEIDQLVAALRGHAHKPPVVYFCEYLDAWSMGDVYVRWLSPGGKRGPAHVASDRFDLYHYPLPDGGALEEWLRRGLRLRRLRERNPQEERWFVTNLLEAATAWEGVLRRSALLVVRECVCGTASDDDVSASLTKVPAWLRRVAPGNSLR